MTSKGYSSVLKLSMAKIYKYSA